jgi:hypothetical protein
MADMHQKPEPPSESTAEVRTRSIEERLAYYAHLEENVYDAFKQGERVVIEGVEKVARFEPHRRIAASAPQGGWDG